MKRMQKFSILFLISIIVTSSSYSMGNTSERPKGRRQAQSDSKGKGKSKAKRKFDESSSAPQRDPRSKSQQTPLKPFHKSASKPSDSTASSYSQEGPKKASNLFGKSAQNNDVDTGSPNNNEQDEESVNGDQELINKLVALLQAINASNGFCGIPRSVTPGYKQIGYFKKKGDIDSVKMQQVLQAAPNYVKAFMRGLKNKTELLRNSLFRRLILYGEPGNGKTTLGTYMIAESFGQCYVLSCTNILNSYKNCHGNLNAEIEPFIQKKEPIGILFDEMNVVTDQYKKKNSSDENMPAAFQTLLDRCADLASHIFILGTMNNGSSDLPDAVNTRFQGSKVHIPYPNFETRKRIVDYQLKERDHNLSSDEILDITERLDNRSCRYVIRVIDYAALFSICYEDRSLTYQDILLAIQANPREPSTDEILAEETQTTVERIRELRARQHILESNATVLDHLNKQAQQAQSAQQHAATTAQSANQHATSTAQSAQQHAATTAQSANQHVTSTAQSAQQHAATTAQSANQHATSTAQSAQQHQQNHARQNVDGFFGNVVQGAIAGGAMGTMAGGIGAIPGAISGAIFGGAISFANIFTKNQVS